MDAAAVERLIADSQGRSLPAMTRRRAQLPELAGKPDIVVGMRRAGKTTFLFQHMNEVLGRGVPRERLLYINFEDERLQPIATSELALIPDLYFRRYPEHRGSTCWLYFDEIQLVANWEQFVRRLLDTERVHIVVTGSSARLLGPEIGSSLRGRGITTEIFPFDFEEVVRHGGLSVPARWPPAAGQRSHIEGAFQSYLAVGGFPEVQSLAPTLRHRVLREYIDGVLFRDVVERHGVTNTQALRYLVRSLLRAPAGAFSINRLYNDLRSQGIAVSKGTLHEYLAHLEDAFLVFPVTIGRKSVRAQAVNPRKLYVVDHGLALASAFLGADDIGHLLENIVYMALRRAGLEAHYYLSDAGHEVDFVVHDHTGPAPNGPALYQVSASLEGAVTVERELRALDDAMTELGLATATVITAGSEGTILRSGRTIRVVPAWQWLLERAAEDPSRPS